MSRYKPLIYSLFISLGAGGLSALLTRDAMEQYKNLRQPMLSPPGWVFSVVWTILFIMMGIAAWLIYKSHNPMRRQALFFYGLQLVFNVGWTLIFFGGQKFLLAFFWLILLELLIGITAVMFSKIDRRAGLLMLPYFLWVLFAGYLNFNVWLLNQ